MSLLNCHLYGLPKLDKRAASASPRRTVLTCIDCVPTGVISPLHVHHFHPSPMKVLPSIVSSYNKEINGPTPFICLGCKWKPQKNGQTSVATNLGSGFWDFFLLQLRWNAPGGLILKGWPRHMISGIMKLITSSEALGTVKLVHSTNLGCQIMETKTKADYSSIATASSWFLQPRFWLHFFCIANHL